MPSFAQLKQEVRIKYIININEISGMIDALNMGSTL
jgi:hypothetical protein